MDEGKWGAFHGGVGGVHVFEIVGEVLLVILPFALLVDSYDLVM